MKGVYCSDAQSNLYSGAAQNTQCGAVERRQTKVHTEMHTSARKTDRKYNPLANLQDGAMGPVQAYLHTFGRVRGLVVGAFGECSTDVHELIRAMSAIGAQRGWRTMGARSLKDAASALKRNAVRSIGIEAVRGHARLKLDRLAWMTGDMDAGAQRRSKARFGANAGRRAYERANGPRHWARSHGGHYD